LAEKASTLLEARSSRRGFLYRSALVGTALATNPVELVTRPVSAYAAVCDCRGQPCPCGTACCDGYTAFCCNLTGSNTCPSGTILGGWWKADGSGFCGDAPRYYMDCNVLPGSESVCYCHCSGDDCNNRVECCSGFRYGQCHQEYAQLGRIYCRVVTCTPPWAFDATCTTTSATDQATATHTTYCLTEPVLTPPPHPPYITSATWNLAINNPSPAPNINFLYGAPGDIPIMGDWNGDGYATPGVRRGDQFILSNGYDGSAAIAFVFGNAGDIPVVGDWTGKGYDTVGVFRNGQWYLLNRHGRFDPDITFTFGQAGDIPVPGRWTGKKLDTPGVFRKGDWYLRTSNTTGPTEIAYTYGTTGDIPIAGDWNGDGRTTAGVFRKGTWYLRENNVDGSGATQRVVNYGISSDSLPVAGWFSISSRQEGIGIVR
jgi:hypothetical protein